MSRKRNIWFILGYGKKHGKRESHLVRYNSGEELAPTLTTVSFMNVCVLEEYDDNKDK